MPIDHVLLDNIRQVIKAILCALIEAKGSSSDKEEIQFTVKPEGNVVHITWNNFFTALLAMGIYYSPNLMVSNVITLPDGRTFALIGGTIYRVLSEHQCELIIE